MDWNLYHTQENLQNLFFARAVPSLPI